MTQQDKELLLKDLCARLPYGVFVEDDMKRTYKLTIGNSYLIDLFYNNGDYVDVPIKPYLRPISSMTEEEVDIFTKFSVYDEESEYILPNYKAIEWLIENHFDYLGLIDYDLAIKVTKENNPYK